MIEYKTLPFPTYGHMFYQCFHTASTCDTEHTTLPHSVLILHSRVLHIIINPYWTNMEVWVTNHTISTSTCATYVPVLLTSHNSSKEFHNSVHILVNLNLTLAIIHQLWEFHPFVYVLWTPLHIILLHTQW